MARERSKPEAQATQPSEFAVTSPQPSGDYTYTLEVVMGMQKTLGELTQAVRSLTEQVKDQGVKVDASCKDIHAAKVVVGVLAALEVAASTVFGFVAKAVIDYFSRVPVQK